MLWQLPETFGTTRAARDILGQLRGGPRGRPVAATRWSPQQTFEKQEAYALLREHDIACVLADTAEPVAQGRGRTPPTSGTSGCTATPSSTTSGYNDEALDAWAARITAWDDAQDAFVYFDNDAKGYAPHDARRLIDRLGPAEQRTR